MAAHPRDEPRRQALRLTFDYEGEDIVLRRSERIDKRVPPSDPLLREGESASRSGFWIELVGDDDRATWRRVLDDPRVASAEAPAGDRAGELMRATVEMPRGTFRVLLPDRGDGRHVCVLASPLAPGARPGRARLVARFDLATGDKVGPEAQPPTSSA